MIAIKEESETKRRNFTGVRIPRNRTSEIDKLTRMAQNNHYQKASDCFHENTKRTSGENPVQHDLNEGLHALSAGIQMDLAEIKSDLKKILDELGKRPTR